MFKITENAEKIKWYLYENKNENLIAEANYIDYDKAKNDNLTEGQFSQCILFLIGDHYITDANPDVSGNTNRPQVFILKIENLLIRELEGSQS